MTEPPSEWNPLKYRYVEIADHLEAQIRSGAIPPRAATGSTGALAPGNRARRAHSQDGADRRRAARHGGPARPHVRQPAAQVARQVTDLLKIPTIGIGAGPHVSGQVLVYQDVLGLNPGFKPKFLRVYAKTFEVIQTALNAYDGDVKSGAFPSEIESYNDLEARRVTKRNEHPAQNGRGSRITLASEMDH